MVASHQLAKRLVAEKVFAEIQCIGLLVLCNDIFGAVSCRWFYLAKHCQFNGYFFLVFFLREKRNNFKEKKT